MEWTNRGDGAPQSTNQAAGPVNPASQKRNRGKFGFIKGLRIVTVVLLFSAAIIIVGLLLLIVRYGDNTYSEAKYVNDKQLQAVFLNGGQVYFGHIDTLNTKYMRLSDIYYLRVNQQVQPDQKSGQAQNDISLVKLGCELHGPQDQMVIYREQIIFWENLKSDGQVAKAVDTYKQQNPNGQNCAAPAQTNNSSTPATTPATNSTTKKP